MKEVFKKILERLILESSSCNVYKLIKPNTEDVAEFNAYKKCIEIVQEAAKEYHGGWIPVSERLPEPDEYILVSFSNFPLPDIGRYEKDAYGGGAFYPGDCDKSYSSINVFVNAWMPLPEAYKESEG